MFRLLMTVAVASLIALPELGHAAPAQAKSGNAKSSNAESSVGNADSLEVSAARRHRYHQSQSRSASTRVTVRPAHRYGWRYHPPYGPHPSDLASNSHPYFVPGAPKFAPGFRHDGFGTGAYGFGYQ